jgi:DNA-binding transcriptional MocR family regulator
MLVGAGGHQQGPLYRRLSQGLGELIDRGELPPLAQLPPERALAEALAMSRTTVVAAYRVLRDDGRLVSRQGSGTTVRATPRATVSSEELAGDRAAAQFLNGPLAPIDFATAALPALDLVAEVAAGITADDYLALTREHHGYHLRGLPALRERIARWYSDQGFPTTADEILITSGAQQALELIARGCLQPADHVIVEEPTYRGALEAFGRSARIRAVRTDPAGLDLAALEVALDNQWPRLIYVQSTGQNPTGAILAPTRRARLVRLAESVGAILVDDTSLSGTVFDAPRPAVALGTADSLITVGSMSKLFWGGLRLGWIRASVQVASRLAQVRGITDLGSSLITQEIARRLFDRIDEAAAQRKTQLTTGLQTLTGLLSDQLPTWTWHPPVSGASLWVRLPQGNATHFAQVALRYGVAILPGAVFSGRVDGPAAGRSGVDDHTRLPYALPPEVLREGVERLAQAWQAYVVRGLGEVSVSSAVT